MAVPMTSALEGAAGNIVPNGFERDFIDIVFGSESTAQVVPQIPSDCRWILEFLVDTIPLVVDGMEPDWIGESEKKPQDYVAFEYATLTGKELALLTGSKDLLLRNSSIDVEGVITIHAAKGYDVKLDKAIMGVGTPAAWGANGSFKLACEAAVNNVYDAGAVDGAGNLVYNDVAEFFSAMLGELEGNENWDEASTRWFIRPRMKQVLRDERTILGVPLLVTNISGQDGGVNTIYGHPVTWVMDKKWPIHTSGAQYDVFLVDMSKVAIGVKPDGISYAKSTEASYTDAGSGDLVSAFENDETVYRWHAIFAFTVVDEEAVVGGLVGGDATGEYFY
jgi:HK97 family phage major capsid protein